MPSLRVLPLLAVSLLAVAALLLAGPIPQDPAYHAFADARTLWHVDNFWNVMSNLPFVLAGAIGLYRCRRLVGHPAFEAYAVLSAAVVLVGFGSAYYHESPSNGTLLWDRLPLTVAFMALFHLLLQERVVPSIGRVHLWLLVAAGAGSVVYWIATEAAGRGDLRPYVLVQFLPVLLMPLIVLLFRGRYIDDRRLLGAIGLYAAAKAFEMGDAALYAAVDGVGGHAVKHVMAAVAVLYVVVSVRRT